MLLGDADLLLSIILVLTLLKLRLRGNFLLHVGCRRCPRSCAYHGNIEATDVADE